MLHSFWQGAWRRLIVAVLGLCMPLAVARAEPPASQALSPEAARKIVADLKNRQIDSLTAEELAGLLAAKKVLAEAVGGAPTIGPSPEAEKEMANLQGVWEVTSYQVGGKPDASKEGLKWVIDRKWYVVLRNYKGEEELDTLGSFTLDLSHDPKAIDLHQIIPKETTQGIYKFDRGELKLLCTSTGKDRPIRFADQDEPDIQSWVMRRLKDSGELALVRKTLKNEHLDDAPAGTESPTAKPSDPKEGDTVVIDTLTKRASVYNAPFANGLDDTPLGSIANGTLVHVLRTETNSRGKTWHFITWDPKDVEDGKVSIPAATTRGWVGGLTVRKPDANK